MLFLSKIIKIMFSLSVLLLMSCVEEIDYSLPRNEVSRNITTVSSDTITNHELLEEFSKALAYSLDSSIELRRIIKNEALFDENKLNHFEKTIKNFKSNLSWTKEDIVKEFFTMIPDFGHKETGKYLDGKM